MAVKETSIAEGHRQVELDRECEDTLAGIGSLVTGAPPPTDCQTISRYASSASVCVGSIVRARTRNGRASDASAESSNSISPR